MKDKHLVIVSIDALVFEDLEFARTLPAFSKIMNDCSCINRVKSVYPTSTHTVHASIISGCNPKDTQITANERFTPGELNKPWYNDLSEIKCKTLLHAAHEAGYKTAACRWPVTAGDNGIIDYLIPEVMDLDKVGYENDILQVYRNLGTTECVMDIVESALNLYGSANSHPEYDNFQIYCAAEIIRRYKPNLLLTHPGYVDSMRHRTGVFSSPVKTSIIETDRWLSMLLDAICDAGISDKTDIILLSDHGQINISRSVCINVFLADKGYINVDENGELLSWDAYAMSCGASAQVFLSRTDDKKLYDDVYEILKDMADVGIYGFEQVITDSQAEKYYGLKGEFSFILETDGYTSFRDDWERPAVKKLDITDYRYGYATHGYMPEKGPQPIFIAKGPSFKKGVVLECGNILNHAPTIAKALNMDLPWAEGKPETEILK